MPTPFDFTPEQKGLLASLSHATGQPIPALLAQALDALPGVLDDAHPSAGETASVLDIFREARTGVPDATWKALPEDLAAEHDHYLYGTPKRSP